MPARLLSCLAVLLLAVPCLGDALDRRIGQGWRWRPLELPSGADRPVALTCDPDDQLVVLFEQRLARFDGHRWRTLLRMDDDAAVEIRHVVATEYGVALIAADAVHLVRGGARRTLVSGRGRLGVCRTPAGHLLIGERGAIRRLGPVGMEDHLPGPPIDGDYDLAASGDALYACTVRTAFVHDGAGWRPIPLSEHHLPDRSDTMIRRMMAARDGVRLVVQQRGVPWRVLHFDGRATRLERGLAGITVHAHLTLSSGAQVVAAATGAPLRVHEGDSWVGVTPGALEHHRVTGGCWAPNGRLCLLVESGRLLTCDLGTRRWLSYRETGGPRRLTQMNVNAIAPSRRGGYWLACSNAGLLRWVEGRGVVERHLIAGDTELRVLTTVHEDDAGHVWTGSGSEFTGARRFDGARWHRHEEPDGIGRYCVHAIRPGLDGALWFALLAPRAGQLTPNGGLARRRNGDWRRYTTADGLPHDRCYDVAVREGTSPATYAGTLGGLAILEGDRWRAVGSRAGVRALFVDRAQRLWVGHGHIARGISAYGSDGPLPLPTTLANIAMSADAFTSTPDGALWFTARDGVHRYDPKLRLHTRPSDEPDMRLGRGWPILSSRDGRVLVGLMGRGLVRLIPDRQPPQIVALDVATKDDGNTLVVRWTARDAWDTTARDRLRARWRLDDGPWSPLSIADSVTIPNVAAGAHRLQVQAFDSSGNPSPVATHELSVSAQLSDRPLAVAALLGLIVAILGLLVALLRDRRQRRLAEIERQKLLEASERKFRALVESAHLLLASLDADGDLAYLSPGLAELIGIPDAEDTIGRAPADVFENVHESDRDILERLQSPDASTTHAEFRVRLGTGEYRWVFARRSPRGRGEAGTDLVGVDITERKAAEEAMRHAEKLKSLGVLAGGIAHDVNNLLMGILGHTELLEAALGEGQASEHVNEIIRACQRCAELCRQMLAYAGQGQFRIEVIDLAALVSEMSQFIRATISRRIELVLELPDDLPGVRGDAAQLRQVLLNFLTNAADAIGDADGHITVRAGTRDLRPDDLRELVVSEGLRPRRVVFLEVADDGGGMDPETLEHIFDPFFSTKTEGRGLGLAAVLGIVRAHDGGLGLYSEPGIGSTFTLLLPSSGEPAPRTKSVRHKVRPKGERQVLVMDDDPTVRLVVRRMLELEGWKVLVAEDGPTGIAMLREHRANIDAVIMDMTMPGGSAEETHAGIRSITPSIPLLIISGFVESSVVGEWQSDGPSAFIQKPFRKGSLLDGLGRAGLALD